MTSTMTSTVNSINAEINSQFVTSNLTVDTLVDEDDNNISPGDVSLREAIRFASSGETINFASNLAGSITLTQGELAINKSLVINGSGADRVTVSGNNTSRVFNITGSDTTVNLNRVTISGGNADIGGGVWVGTGSTLNLSESVISNNSAINGGGIFNSGTLNLTDSSVTNNAASGAGGGGIQNAGNGAVTLTNSAILGNSAQQGGGIENFGTTVTLTNSIVSNNSANFGGGIHNGSNSTVTLMNTTVSGNSVVNSGGGIDSSGVLSLTNSTISGNSASNIGGGIDNSGTATLNNSTIAGNSANFGGGVNNFGTAEVVNTIIAGNTGPTPDVRGTFSDRGNNLIGNNTGSSGFTTSTLVGTGATPIDPKLSPLQDNGGLTPTHALLPDSPAINAGNTSVVSGSITTDQRGQTRIIGSGVDIGAFESQPVPPPIIPPSPDPIPDGDGGGVIVNPRPRTIITDTHGRRTFAIAPDSTTVISDFGGAARRARSSAVTTAEVDTLQFQGARRVARNMVLSQTGSDVELTFEGVPDTKVVLQDFALENLENQGGARRTSRPVGNILFDGQTTIQDSYDVFDANSRAKQVLKRNTVTFLNERNNVVDGFDRSNDVINGQGGRDRLTGLSGNDLLRGGAGNDNLLGGFGSDTLVGGVGADQMTGGKGRDRFILSSAAGADTITDFQNQQDRIGLSGMAFTDLTITQGTGANRHNTLVGFNTGSGSELLAVLTGIRANTITAADFIKV